MESKTILVTGANRGIGFETCRQLACIGRKVILTARSKKKGEAARRALQAEGWQVDFRRLDVAAAETFSAFAHDLSSTYDRVDVLINDAAVYQDNGYDAKDVPFEVMQHTMAVNFYGPVYLSQTLLPLLKKSTEGRIINISSGMGATTHLLTKR